MRGGEAPLAEETGPKPDWLKGTDEGAEQPSGTAEESPQDTGQAGDAVGTADLPSVDEEIVEQPPTPEQPIEQSTEQPVPEPEVPPAPVPPVEGGSELGSEGEVPQEPPTAPPSAGPTPEGPSSDDEKGPVPDWLKGA